MGSYDDVGHEFLSKLRINVPTFVVAVEETLAQKHNVNVLQLEADHVCWRTETWKDYTDLVTALKACREDCTLLIESTIGGRPIATFELRHPIPIRRNEHKNEYHNDADDHDGRMIRVIEIPAPKPGRAYRRGLEHVEFVIGNVTNTDSHMPLTPVNDHRHEAILDDFINKHPQVSWDIKAKTKHVNPDISIKLDLEKFGTCSVKFHLMPLAKVIDYEKNHNMIA